MSAGLFAGGFSSAGLVFRVASPRHRCKRCICVGRTVREISIGLHLLLTLFFSVIGVHMWSPLALDRPGDLVLSRAVKIWKSSLEGLSPFTEAVPLSTCQDLERAGWQTVPTHKEVGRERYGDNLHCQRWQMLDCFRLGCPILLLLRSCSWASFLW